MEPPDFISVLRFLLLLLLIAFIFLTSPLCSVYGFLFFSLLYSFYFAPWFSFFLLWVNM